MGCTSDRLIAQSLHLRLRGHHGRGLEQIVGARGLQDLFRDNVENRKWKQVGRKGRVSNLGEVVVGDEHD